MSDWWTYGPSDFLLFSPRVYYRLFELHNHALWPAQIAALVLGLSFIFLLLRPSETWTRLAFIALGLLWIWVSWAFLWERYATINWAAAYVAPVFGLQGVLLIAAALWGQRLDLDNRWDAATSAAIIVLTISMLVFPVLPVLSGRSWHQGEVFGIAPDPTALATLALLALTRSPAKWLLMIVPAAWCALTGLTLWTMGAGHFWIAPLFALIAIGAALARSHGPSRG